MKDFLNADFLLTNDTAKTLFNNYAAQMPIIDYHCHVSPKEIAENRRFENISQVWLGGDHYKWRLMRANGAEESFVTGNASDYEKFRVFAETLPKAIGNPVYQWAHLELKRYFDCDLIICPENVDKIWEICSQKLSEESFSVRGLIKRSNVTHIATTDDPIDDLKWHKIIKEDPTFDTTVIPAFRPDRAINIEKPDFVHYIEELGKAAQMEIKTFDDLKVALVKRMDYFAEMGCVASDHGLDFVPFHGLGKGIVDKIFESRLNGEKVRNSQMSMYKSAVICFLFHYYAKLGWTAQLHFGAVRNVNNKMFAALGPDVGNDAISKNVGAAGLCEFLSALEASNRLPKTVLYSLNPNDDAVLVAMAGCFPQAGVVGKIQHGAPWWYNDNKQGMEAQLTNLANKGLLGSFIGMLTDSRSFLSYTRHEYFRRVLCNLIGTWVEDGEYPADIEGLGRIIQDISYNNTKKYFGFN